MNLSNLNQMKTVEIKTIKHLEAVLKCSRKEIEEIIATIDEYYYEDRKEKLLPNGKLKIRILHPSKGKLKEIQKCIKDRILSQIELPHNIKGGLKGCCNVSNAKEHQGKKYKFLTDLKNFYPSISYTRVFEMFIKNGFSSKTASILTHLTTYKYALPQGTPTSTHIANLVFVPIDYKIIELCHAHNVTYSRYVDDLTFSSPNDFKSITQLILSFVTAEGYKISYKKTHYQTSNALITGVLVKQNVITVSKDFKTKLRDEPEGTQRKKGLENYQIRVKEFKKAKRG